MPQYDQAKRRRAVRKGREKGAWIFVPAEELEAAGVDVNAEEPPYYRLWSRAKRGNGNGAPGSVLVQLYLEP
jgi:hypothetical protein